MDILGWLATGRVELGLVYNPPSSPNVERVPSTSSRSAALGLKPQIALEVDGVRPTLDLV